MKLLLDTHAFIWWDSHRKNLPERVVAVCEDSTNTLHVSIASVWEMQIKAQLGNWTCAAFGNDLVRTAA